MVPCVRLTSVLPMLRTENMLGALMSYQSFFVNGSTLRTTRHTRGESFVSHAAQSSRSKTPPEKR